MTYQRTILVIGSVILLLFSFSGCKKEWLDVKSNSNQRIPISLNDYQGLLNNSVLYQRMMALVEVSSDGHFVNESVWSSSSFPMANNAYTWSQGTPYTEFFPWIYVYNRIYHVNVVLDGIKSLKISGDAEQNQYNYIRAQALFHKAENYYWLSQHYAQPYNSVTASTDLGIVFQDDSDVTKPVYRGNVQQTYDAIIEYLKEAAVSLPVTPLVPTQASSPAAYALLARTYLAMQQYDAAWEYADKSLKLNSNLMNYNSLSTTATFIGRFNTEVLFHDLFYTSELSNFITSGCLIDPNLYNSYDDNDLRKTIYFRKNGDAIFFKGTYNNSPTNLFCGVAIDEVYLMRAEGYARKGNVMAAMKDLNDLLHTRWREVDGISTYVNKVTNTADEALRMILEERKKELLLRGLRWMDLRRLNKEDRFKTTLSRTIGGTTYTLEPNSHKYTFPIPSNIIELSRVPQTKGW